MDSMRGFSLIEVLVVLGMSALVIVIATLAPVASFQRLSVQSDRETLLTTLLYARSIANESGVFVRNNEYVVFRGPSYNERREDADYPFQRATTGGEEVEFLFSNQGTEERTLSHPAYRISVSSDGHIRETTLLP